MISRNKATTMKKNFLDRFIIVNGTANLRNSLLNLKYEYKRKVIREV